MNFNYLENTAGYEGLLKFCNEAESYCYSNPSVSVTQSRKALEYLVKNIYSVVVNGDDNCTIFDMLETPALIDFVDNKSVMKAFHFIRKNGNLAAHGSELTSEDSLDVLEQLHFVVGEISVKLGVVEKYPQFNNKISRVEVLSTDINVTNDEAEALKPLMTRLLKNKVVAKNHLSEGNRMIDIHMNTTDKSNGVSVDSGANSKNAFLQLIHYLKNEMGDNLTYADQKLQQFVLRFGDECKVFCVKSGCPVLGYKNAENEWEPLPDIDYVLYAIDFNNDDNIASQVRIFGKEEFLDFWEVNNSIRYKVSSAKYRQLRSVYGDDYKANAETDADTMSVQSFMNCGRKKRAILETMDQKQSFSEWLNMLC